MKVIQVLNNFLPYQVGGTEVYTWSLCKYLQIQGVEVKVVTPNFGKNKDDNYFFDDLAVHKYSEPSIVDRSLIMGFRSPDGLNNFVSFLDDEKPDIIHFHELSGSNGITLKHVQIAKIRRIKIVMTFHVSGYSCKTGTLFYIGESECNGVIHPFKCSKCFLHAKGYKISSSYVSYFSDLLHKMSIDTSKINHRLGTALSTVSLISKQKENLLSLVSFCDQVVTVSKWYKKVLIENDVEENKITHISQGLPFSSKFLKNENIITKTPLKLIFLGRINKFKGLHLLIEAIEIIDSSLISLSIYGNTDDIDYESNLRHKTINNSNIFWRGKLNQQDVLQTLSEHSLLCLCSTTSEMSPIVIQESFAAGIPVLASNVYGNSEQIQHNKNGLLFKFNNVNDLRFQILRCINDPNLISNLTLNILLPNSFDTVGSEYYELYKSLLR